MAKRIEQLVKSRIRYILATDNIIPVTADIEIAYLSKAECETMLSHRKYDPIYQSLALARSKMPMMFYDKITEWVSNREDISS